MDTTWLLEPSIKSYDHLIKIAQVCIDKQFFEIWKVFHLAVLRAKTKSEKIPTSTFKKLIFLNQITIG